MERLKYQIEDATIAELLGRNNFTNAESAILELVKNAYDAFAKTLDIYFENNKIVLIDTGIGMNESDIKNNWMRVGFSGKGYELELNNEKRVLSGSKGIGRFALSRLGEHILIETKKDTFNAVKWETNWEYSVLDNIDKEELGTKITIYKPRDKWNENSIKQLKKYLSKTYNDTKMKINIHFMGMEYEISKYFSNPKIGVNFLSSIEFKYHSTDCMLEYIIESDEFKEEASKYCPNMNLKYKAGIINVLELLKNNKDINCTEDEFIKYLHELGDFSGKMFYVMKATTSKEIEKFLYKHVLESSMEEGVILYRNAFSISSFEGKKDWLGFGKRSRKSPAAATHPTGSWRVRENQISGYINIDKSTNKNLQDLSNRQGLDENIYFVIFLNIILLGISEFESYRQDIIRKINKKNNIEALLEKSEHKIIEIISKDPKKLDTLKDEEKLQLAEEIKSFKKDNEYIKREMNEHEQRYKYDVRILNVLSTLGLRASSIAHELQNDKNFIYKNIDSIIKRLDELQLWKIVNNIENKQYACDNIPQMLEENRRINVKMIEFMDTMLTDIENDQFEVSDVNINTEVDYIIKKWKNDYSWVKFENLIDKKIFLTTSKDILKVIFDNLILNSIQQNDKRGHIDIIFNAKQLGNKYIEFEYYDDGIGLPKKFIENPRKILEVHQTSRKKGHGLGMWIINNTLSMTGGEVKEIYGESGFKIIFTLGESM